MEERFEIISELIFIQSLHLSKEGMLLLGFITSKRKIIEDSIIIKIQILESLCSYTKISENLKDFFKALIIYNSPRFAFLISIYLIDLSEDEVIINLPENMQILYNQICEYNKISKIVSINISLHVGIIESLSFDIENDFDEKCLLKNLMEKMEDMKLKTSTKKNFSQTTSEKKMPDCHKNHSEADRKILETPKREIKEVELQKKNKSSVGICPECKFWLLKAADFTKIDCPHKG